MNILTTDRLTLRPLTLEDARHIFLLFNDPVVLELVGNRDVTSIGAAERYLLDGPIRRYRERGAGMMAVEDSSGSFVGTCGLTHTGVDGPDELGFLMCASSRGKGFALEASTAVMRDCFGRLALETLYAVTSIRNATSQRTLKRLGFAVVETRPAELVLSDDELGFAISRSQFAKTQLA